MAAHMAAEHTSTSRQDVLHTVDITQVQPELAADNCGQFFGDIDHCAAMCTTDA